MVYIWRIAEDYPDELIGLYQVDISPDRLELSEGKTLPSNFDTLYFQCPTTEEKVREWNIFSNNANVPLVDKNVVKILKEFAGEDVQMFNAVIQTNTGEINDYKVLNVTHTVLAIDHNKSKYSLIKGTSVILKFTKLVYKDNCLSKYQIARNEEYKPHIIVSQRIKDLFISSNIKGVEFLYPENIL